MEADPGLTVEYFHPIINLFDFLFQIFIRRISCPKSTSLMPSWPRLDVTLQLALFAASPHGWIPKFWLLCLHHEQALQKEFRFSGHQFTPGLLTDAESQRHCLPYCRRRSWLNPWFLLFVPSPLRFSLLVLQNSNSAHPIAISNLYPPLLFLWFTGFLDLLPQFSAPLRLQSWTPPSL